MKEEQEERKEADSERRRRRERDSREQCDTRGHRRPEATRQSTFRRSGQASGSADYDRDEKHSAPGSGTQHNKHQSHRHRCRRTALAPSDIFISELSDAEDDSNTGSSFRFADRKGPGGFDLTDTFSPSNHGKLASDNGWDEQAGRIV